MSSSLSGGEGGVGPEGRSQSLEREEDEGVGEDRGRQRHGLDSDGSMTESSFLILSQLYSDLSKVLGGWRDPLASQWRSAWVEGMNYLLATENPLTGGGGA